MTKKTTDPHTFVIVFSIIVIAAVASWFVDGGEYTRVVKVMPDGITATSLTRLCTTALKIIHRPGRYFLPCFRGSFQDQT